MVNICDVVPNSTSLEYNNSALFILFSEDPDLLDPDLVLNNIDFTIISLSGLESQFSITYLDTQHRLSLIYLTFNYYSTAQGLLVSI